VVALGVLDVSNVEGAGVSLDVLEDTNTTDVVTADNEDLSAVLVLDEALNFAALKVNLSI
jgi:hypothetical protein